MTCKALVQPAQNAAKYDGGDNNCDGQVDQNTSGPVGPICDRARCTRNCDNQLPCPGGLACDRGRGVDAGRVDMDCTAGQACQAAACVPTCTGAVCPGGQKCTAGPCIDDDGSGQDMATDDSGADTVGGSVALSACTCNLNPTTAAATPWASAWASCSWACRGTVRLTAPTPDAGPPAIPGLPSRLLPNTHRRTRTPGKAAGAAAPTRSHRR